MHRAYFTPVWIYISRTHPHQKPSQTGTPDTGTRIHGNPPIRRCLSVREPSQFIFPGGGVRRHVLMPEPADGTTGSDCTLPSVVDRTQGWLALNYDEVGLFSICKGFLRASCVPKGELRRAQVQVSGRGEFRPVSHSVLALQFGDRKHQPRTRNRAHF